MDSAAADHQHDGAVKSQPPQSPLAADATTAAAVVPEEEAPAAPLAAHFATELTDAAANDAASTDDGKHQPFAVFKDDDETTPTSAVKVPVPFMSSNDGLSEDTIKYIKDNNIGQLMEYILRGVLNEKPARPLQFVHELTACPFPPQLALAGPPASGKGTQAKHICAHYKRTTGKKPVHVSSGDLLRSEVERGTHLGKIAEACMQRGELVPDSLIIGVIRNRLTQADAVLNGWLLDGFPRNRSQAIALDAAGLCPRMFLVLDAPDEILFERVEGRRTDPVTGAIYHLKFNPPPEGDEALMERLQHRDDDTRDVLGPRLDTYHAMVDGLLDYYGSIMYRVDANRPEGQITRDITEYIKANEVV